MLAGDNAIVVGMAAAGLPRHMRAKVILIGISAAHRVRILFAVVANSSCSSSALPWRRHPAALGLLEVLARAGA